MIPSGERSGFVPPGIPYFLLTAFPAGRDIIVVGLVKNGFIGVPPAATAEARTSHPSGCREISTVRMFYPSENVPYFPPPPGWRITVPFRRAAIASPTFG